MMKKKAMAITMALSTGLVLAACGSDDSDNNNETTASTSAEQPAVAIPTAAELTDILNRAVDPELPVEEKTNSVVGGDTAPQLFEALTAMRADTGAELRVVDPVLPGIIPTQVNATLELTTPEEEPMVINDVQFVHEDDTWKLDQRWACTLVQNVLPDQVPEMCQQYADDAAPAPEGEQPLPPEGQQPPAPQGDVPPAPEGELPPPPEGQAPPAPEPAPAP